MDAIQPTQGRAVTNRRNKEKKKQMTLWGAEDSGVYRPAEKHSKL
jgi:hypothetical protein